MATGAGKRAKRLLGLVLLTVGGERVRSYISRATGLYVAGYQEECIVMVRSALEAALFARLTEILQPDDRVPGLEELIALAGRHGILGGWVATTNRRGWKAREGSPLALADGLRRQGNHLIHEDLSLRSGPDEPQDAFNSIRNLTQVLGVLFPPGSH